MRLPGRFWERPLVLPLILLPGGFVAGVLVSPLLYFLTYGDFWKSMGATLIGFATIGAVFGSAFGVVDFFTALPRIKLRRAQPVSGLLYRRGSSPRIAA